MRLVDADELLPFISDKTIALMINNFAFMPEVAHWRIQQNPSKGKLVKRIECSCCGETFNAFVLDPHYNFCPYCGTKMEGDY